MTTTPATQAVTFAELLDANTRISAGRLEKIRRDNEGKPLSYLADFGMRETVIAETVAELYANATRTAERNGDPAERLADNIVTMLRDSGRSTDAFATAATEARRDAAHRVLREMSAYLDAAEVFALLAR